MTDETKVGQDGAGENTNSPVSPAPVTVDAKTLAELVEGLKSVKSEIGGIYSRQDKDRNNLREFMDEVKKFQGKGLSEDQAIDAAQGAIKDRADVAAEKQMLKEIHARLIGSPSAQTAGNGASGQVNAAQVFEQLGLNPTDPDVVIELGKGFKTEAEAKIAAYEYSVRKSKQPSPTQAQASSMQGSVPAPQNVAAKIAKLQELQKFPTKNMSEIKKMEAELDAVNWR